MNITLSPIQLAVVTPGAFGSWAREAAGTPSPQASVLPEPTPTVTVATTGPTGSSAEASSR